MSAARMPGLRSPCPAREVMANNQGIPAINRDAPAVATIAADARTSSRGSRCLITSSRVRCPRDKRRGTQTMLPLTMAVRYQKRDPSSRATRPVQTSRTIASAISSNAAMPQRSWAARTPSTRISAVSVRVPNVRGTSSAHPSSSVPRHHGYVTVTRIAVDAPNTKGIREGSILVLPRFGRLDWRSTPPGHERPNA